MERRSTGHIIELASILGTFIVCFVFLFGQIHSLGDKLDRTTVALNERIDMSYRMFHEESKDFHGRLCAIEERNKK